MIVTWSGGNDEQFVDSQMLIKHLKLPFTIISLIVAFLLGSYQALFRSLIKRAGHGASSCPSRLEEANELPSMIRGNHATKHFVIWTIED